MAFHGPIWALINMFIHVLQNPSSPVVSSDLALMDIGTAHFSRLELATDSDLSFPFARDLTRLARAAVDHSRAAPKLPEYEGNVPDSLHRTRQGPATKEVDRIVEASDHAGTFPDVSITSVRFRLAPRLLMPEHRASFLTTFSSWSWSNAVLSCRFLDSATPWHSLSISDGY